MSDLIIDVVGVSKVLQKRNVLNNVSFSMPIGTLYGISGHNGSGKSMLLRVITGLVFPTSGSISVFGQQIGRQVEFPRDTGAMIDGPGILPEYSGMRNLELLAQIRGVVGRDRVVEVLEEVGLDPGDRRPAKMYSMGMKQRLGLAQALLEKPQLLILDEPTNALDREGVEEIHALLKRLHGAGTTVLITSHSQSELDHLCQQTYRMEKGRIAVVDKPNTRL